ncbi:MAG: phenylalanine--tRNA ligase subunit alpha [Methanosarcinales archaeon]|nr:MAG: phenylalanine--tRNA ligase subunit alpha [Methanosarcinales archaeon]
MEIKYDLAPGEATVLQALKNSDELTASVLAASCNQKIEVCVQSAMMLEQKGLVRLENVINERYALTDEGEKYARDGLPERQMLSILPISINEAKKRFPEKLARVSLGWLKRKNWAVIRKGILTPTASAEEIEEGKDEQVLTLLLNKKTIPEAYKKTIPELVKRSLVRIEEDKTRIISLTEAGLKIASEDIDIDATPEVAMLTQQMITGCDWKKVKLKSYDIHITPPPIYGGKLHPYERIIREMRNIFLEMGFTELKGETVQSSFWNFDSLFQPQDHPARDMQDTFYLNSTTDELPSCYQTVQEMHEHGGKINSTGWGGSWSKEKAEQDVLRTHTTPVTIKYLAESPVPPVKAFCIDRVYRREAIDPTHTPEFEQLEGVVMDEGASFTNLLGYLSEFYHRMGFKNVRFRPGYFPYTEPSVEPEVYIEELGWVELGGAGIFRKEVTDPLGITSPVLAWGLGVSRVAMLKLKLLDLRELYQSDINWLRTSSICLHKLY